MKLDKALIKHVSDIARLNLTDKELNEFLPQMKEVVSAFSKISQVNTDKIKPSYHPIILENKMRKDVSKKCLTQKDALKNTLHKKDGYFKGPRVV